MPVRGATIFVKAWNVVAQPGYRSLNREKNITECPACIKYIERYFNAIF